MEKKTNKKDRVPLLLPRSSLVSPPKPIFSSSRILDWNDFIQFIYKSFSYEDQKKLSIADTLTYVAAISYLNFLVTNSVLVTSSYSKDEASIKREKEVKALFKQTFPGREIMFVDALRLNWQGGGIHCST